MPTDVRDDRPDDVRDRITRFMQSNGRACRKEAAPEEAQALRAAAGRLDQMLKQIAESEESQVQQAREKEAQTLRNAASRLDRLLAGVTGNEAMPALKLRRLRNEHSGKR
jgi:regulator of protease activity HflC (stomatin/prohibitin superfamily)